MIVSRKQEGGVYSTAECLSLSADSVATIAVCSNVECENKSL